MCRNQPGAPVPDGRHYAQVRNAKSEYLVRVRPDSSRTWDSAITSAKVGGEEGSVYIYRKWRRRVPSFAIGAGSDLRPAILQSRVRGTESETRQLLDKVSRRAGVSSGCSARAGAGRAERRFHTFKTNPKKKKTRHFKLYSTHTEAAGGLAYPCRGYFRRTKYDCAA